MILTNHSLVIYLLAVLLVVRCENEAEAKNKPQLDKKTWLNHLQCLSNNDEITKISFTDASLECKTMIDPEKRTLPTLDDQSQCHFIKTTSKSVKCDIPLNNMLASAFPEKAYAPVMLPFKVESESDLAEANFTFFNCDSFTTCSQCSEYSCYWCVNEYKCTHDVLENCKNDNLVIGMNLPGHGIRKGPGLCPSIYPIGESKIFVHSGQKKSIDLKVQIFGQYIYQIKFMCHFNIEGKEIVTSTRFHGTTVQCDALEFFFNSKTPNSTATVSLTWGHAKPLDNPENIQIVMYKCHEMAYNCTSCLKLEDKFNCGWCQSSGRCEIKEHCELNKDFVWLHENSTCPAL